MKRIAAGMLAIGGCLVASMAGAGNAPMSSSGWEFAKWGMTPSQLRAASHGTVTATQPGSDALKSPYSMGRFRFTATFDYMPRSNDPGNSNPSNLILDAVMLDLDSKSGACADLAVYLKTSYGKPNRTFASGPAGFLWSKKRFGDIQYSTWDAQKTCSVMYMPLGGHDR